MPLKSTERSILVKVAPEVAFERWRRHEEFPRFWASIGEVRQLDEKHYLVRGTHEGHEYEMTTELILQIPARRLAWRTTSGPQSSGAICFDPEPGGITRVTLKVMYEPDVGWQEPASVDQRISLALQKFKELIEEPQSNS